MRIEEQPLSQYRVLDLSNENGMLFGKIFADLGADVIKVEKPGGDPVRNKGPFYHDIPSKEKSLFWFAYNTGKRSITLDIETNDGREIVERLVKSCDIVVETFAVGYLAKLGLDYSMLSSVNQRIVLVSITPFGQMERYHSNGSSDLVALAVGGLMYTTGDPDRAPIRSSVELSYSLVGIQAVIGALIALHHRHKTRVGEHVDISIQECVVPISWVVPNLWFLNRLILTREGSKAKRVQVVVRQVWGCKDGYISWRLFTGADADKTTALVDWMNEEGMANELKEIDWRTIDMSEVTQDQIDGWKKHWSVFFLSHTKKELYKEAVERGIMLFPVNDFKDLCEDEQLMARNFWTSVVHPELGNDIVYPGPPFKSEEHWWRVKRPPLIGEHNRVIYRELGYSE